ncbi:hypothetical protein BBJ28_00001997 [Nothophytophthora sp. Chile5]|nr:hypothetical protein BBJ28_00001997 [Nothophytophthora sp. Chile5]
MARASSLLLLLVAYCVPLLVHGQAGASQVEVQFDLDPESKLQFDRYAASRSDRPLLDGRLARLEDRKVLKPRPLGGDSSRRQVLEPSTFNFGRGVGYRATADVPGDGELLSLPLDQVMSLSSAAKGRVGLLLQVNPDLPPSIALAVHVLEERALGSASNYSAFLSTLPSMAQLNASMFYSQSELQELEGSQLLRYTQGRIQAVDSFFDALVRPVTSREAVDPPLFEQDAFTLDRFRWAMGVVWACAFPTGDREEDVVLAPVLSTIGLCTEKTCPPPPRFEFDTIQQRLVVYATSPYAQGQEVRLAMTPKPSAQLMLNHGFTRLQASSALDKLDVTVTLDPHDPLADVKGFLFQSTLNESANASYSLKYGSPSLGDALSASLKIKLLSGAEISRYKELLTPSTPESDRSIVSLRNEFVFTRAVVSTCRGLLAQYPTTLEEDQQTLAQLVEQGKADNTRQGQLRRTLVLEKEILRQTMRLALEDWNALILSPHPNLQDI